jgi:glutamine cyclotransferase
MFLEICKLFETFEFVLYIAVNKILEMKKISLLFIIVLSSVLMCYNCSKINTESLFKIEDTAFKTKFFTTNTVDLKVLNPENKVVDSVQYFVNDLKIASKKDLSTYKFDLKSQKFGFQNLQAKVFENGNAEPETIFAKFEIVSDVTPKLLKFEIVKTYSHDITSFTEGLEFYKGVLYENTGLKGKSNLLKTDFETGKILKAVPMDAQYFGEGITILNGKIYQLTWQNKVGFIYNAENLTFEKTFPFDKDIEGWGMTNDGIKIYQSDGTEKIWTMNAETLKMESFVNVYSAKEKIKSVNELEWIDDKIYANIWQKDAIAVVNPATGAVEGILNLASLRKNLTNKEAEVLNGIAYNPATKTIFVTGKNWDKMFEIKVKN